MPERSLIRVLVVDDDTSVRLSIESFLEDAGFGVMGAGSTEEALEMMTKNSFQVAIVDLRLPGESGETLIVKAHQAYPEMDFLIHTGSVGYNLSEELKQIGIRIEQVFRKPLNDLTIMVTTIEEHLASAKLRQRTE